MVPNHETMDYGKDYPYSCVSCVFISTISMHDIQNVGKFKVTWLLSTWFLDPIMCFFLNKQVEAGSFHIELRWLLLLLLLCEISTFLPHI